MSVAVTTIKFCVFLFNLVCLILGVGTIAVSALGLQNAKPNTDEHSYFIVAIILGSLVCLTTIFGFYGVVCELLGVNVVYALFIFLLFIVQYLQMHSYQPHNYHSALIRQLTEAWNKIDTEPQLMTAYQKEYKCCGLFNPTDYAVNNMMPPPSCYQLGNSLEPARLHDRGCMKALQNTATEEFQKEKLFNVALMVAESITFMYAFVLTIILFRRRYEYRANFEVVRGVNEPTVPNHINTGSRANLLSNEVL